jgi:hypothetical protein
MDVPAELQDAGTVGVRASPISCIGTLLAVSLPMAISAVTIDPYEYPSENCAQAASGAPPVSCSCGKEEAAAPSTDAMMRNPLEPVSTRILLTVWHVLVPGTHTRTDTVGTLMTPVAPGPTVSGTVLAALAEIGCLVGAAATVGELVGVVADGVPDAGLGADDAADAEDVALDPPPPHPAIEHIMTTEIEASRVQGKERCRFIFIVTC